MDSKRNDDVSKALRLVGRNVRRLRRYKGLSQQAFAERAGITRGFLSDIERGARSFTVDTLLKLCRAARVDPNYMLGVAGMSPIQVLQVRHMSRMERSMKAFGAKR